MIKRTVLMLCTTIAATAAHAQSYAQPYQMPPLWEGGYVGGNVNYGEGKFKLNGVAAGLVSPYGLGKTIAKPDGVTAALRGGYDWQFDRVVFGMGAEYNFGHYKNGLNGIYAAVPDVSVAIKHTATMFARAGYVMDDQWMGYGMLGYTRAKGEFKAPTGKDSGDLNGTTYGLGMEYRITPQWSAYGEYAYTDFGKVKNTGATLKSELSQVKFGANFRF